MANALPKPANRRALVVLLEELCEEQGIDFTSLCAEWVLLLAKGDRRSHVFGFDFDLNSAGAQLLAKDKAATYGVLTHYGVPAVEHRLFSSPQLPAYIPADGNWPGLHAYFEAHGGDVVCKPNGGTGGKDVFRARSLRELEGCVHRVLARARAVALSPFLDVEQEYRCVVLQGKVLLSYAKDRPTVVGDGRSSLAELMLGHLMATDQPHEQLARLARQEVDLDFGTVPPEGAEVGLGWHHNLALGSRPRLVDVPALADFAVAAAEALKVQVAAIDVVVVDGRMLVLEINTGIMMESLVHLLPDGRELAKGVYRRILEACLRG